MPSNVKGPLPPNLLADRTALDNSLLSLAAVLPVSVLSANVGSPLFAGALNAYLRATETLLRPREGGAPAAVTADSEASAALPVGSNQHKGGYGGYLLSGGLPSCALHLLAIEHAAGGQLLFTHNTTPANLAASNPATSGNGPSPPPADFIPSVSDVAPAGWDGRFTSLVQAYVSGSWSLPLAGPAAVMTHSALCAELEAAAKAAAAAAAAEAEGGDTKKKHSSIGKAKGDAAAAAVPAVPPPAPPSHSSIDCVLCFTPIGVNTLMSGGSGGGRSPIATRKPPPSVDILTGSPLVLSPSEIKQWPQPPAVPEPQAAAAAPAADKSGKGKVAAAVTAPVVAVKSKKVPSSKEQSKDGATEILDCLRGFSGAGGQPLLLVVAQTVEAVASSSPATEPLPPSTTAVDWYRASSRLGNVALRDPTDSASGKSSLHAAVDANSKCIIAIAAGAAEIGIDGLLTAGGLPSLQPKGGFSLAAQCTDVSVKSPLRALAMGWPLDQHQLAAVLQLWGDGTSSYASAASLALQAVSLAFEGQQSRHDAIIRAVDGFLAGQPPALPPASSSGSSRTKRLQECGSSAGITSAVPADVSSLLRLPPSLQPATVSELHMSSTAAIAQRSEALRRIAKAREGAVGATGDSALGLGHANKTAAPAASSNTARCAGGAGSTNRRFSSSTSVVNSLGMLASSSSSDAAAVTHYITEWGLTNDLLTSAAFSLSGVQEASLTSGGGRDSLTSQLCNKISDAGLESIELLHTLHDTASCFVGLLPALESMHDWKVQVEGAHVMLRNAEEKRAIDCAALQAYYNEHLQREAGAWMEDIACLAESHMPAAHVTRARDEGAVTAGEVETATGVQLTATVTAAEITSSVFASPGDSVQRNTEAPSSGASALSPLSDTMGDVSAALERLALTFARRDKRLCQQLQRRADAWLKERTAAVTAWARSLKQALQQPQPTLRPRDFFFKLQ